MTVKQMQMRLGLSRSTAYRIAETLGVKPDPLGQWMIFTDRVERLAAQMGLGPTK